MTFAYTKTAGVAADTTPTLWPGTWTWPDGPGGGVPQWPDDHDFDAIVAADGPWPPGWAQVQVVQVAAASVQVVAPAPTVSTTEDIDVGCPGATFSIRVAFSGSPPYPNVDYTLTGVALVLLTETYEVRQNDNTLLATVSAGTYMGTGTVTSGDPAGYTKTAWLCYVSGLWRVYWNYYGVYDLGAGVALYLGGSPGFSCSSGGAAPGSVTVTPE